MLSRIIRLSLAALIVLTGSLTPAPSSSSGARPSTDDAPPIAQRVLAASGVALPAHRASSAPTSPPILETSALSEEPSPAQRADERARRRPPAPTPKPKAQARTKPAKAWKHDPEISWYGPGLYGNGTACGQTLTRKTIGVAHRSLPCGTRVTFRNPDTGEQITVKVIDRGPFVRGRTWDLTSAACKRIHHCFTGPIDVRLGG